MAGLSWRPYSNLAHLVDRSKVREQPLEPRHVACHSRDSAEGHEILNGVVVKCCIQGGEHLQTHRVGAVVRPQRHRLRQETRHVDELTEVKQVRKRMPVERDVAKQLPQLNAKEVHQAKSMQSFECNTIHCELRGWVGAVGSHAVTSLLTVIRAEGLVVGLKGVRVAEVWVQRGHIVRHFPTTTRRRLKVDPDKGEAAKLVRHQRHLKRYFGGLRVDVTALVEQRDKLLLPCRVEVHVEKDRIVVHPVVRLTVPAAAIVKPPIRNSTYRVSHLIRFVVPGPVVVRCPEQGLVRRGFTGKRQWKRGGRGGG